MKQTLTFEQRLERVRQSLWEFSQIFVELYRGFVRKDPVLLRFLQFSILLGVLTLLCLDVVLFKKLRLWHLYPPDGLGFRLYVAFLLWTPVLCFGVYMRQRKKLFAKKLKEVFEIIGLKTKIGTYPRFLSLEPILKDSMKLRLTNGSFPLKEWKSRKARMEAHLKVFIDEIREVPEKGVIEMTFSYEPMPTKVSIENFESFRNYKFYFGRDRTKVFVGDFSESPHLLVAGESGGGKSAFLRQLITTIKVNQPESEFKLLDFKGAVEFWPFEKLPGMKVISDIEKATRTLKEMAALIDLRVRKLREMNLTDIKYFFSSKQFLQMSVEEKRAHQLGQRIFVVVDECAEIFLFGGGQKAEHIRDLRAAMSRITRLGRSVGIHAVLATQRPDKNAVDPQVKTNLTTTLCYRVNDLGASLSVLGSGRATDLPAIPGRAILKSGYEELEIQTHFLDPKESIKLLEETFKDELRVTEKTNEEKSKATPTEEIP